MLVCGRSFRGYSRSPEPGKKQVRRRPVIAFRTVRKVESAFPELFRKMYLFPLFSGQSRAKRTK